MLLGVPDSAERVPYSIASAPDEADAGGAIEFLVKLEAGGWPPHLRGLRRGRLVKAQGPVGGFVFPRHPEEQQFLFVAGGTGIAPLRSMIVHALRANGRFRLHLLYSARTRLDFAYLTELRRYAREGRLALALNVTREAPRRWRGGRHRITEAQLAPLVEAPDTLCFVCGPEAMVDEVPRMLQRLGVERRRIRLEEW